MLKHLMRLLEEFARLKKPESISEEEFINKLADKKNDMIESYIELVEWCESNGVALKEDE